MRQKIELVTLKDVSDFTEAVSQIDEEVTLIGKDENGKDCLSVVNHFLQVLFLQTVSKEQKPKQHIMLIGILLLVCVTRIFTR